MPRKIHGDKPAERYRIPFEGALSAPILPPLSFPADADTQSEATDPQLFVRRFEFQGNTVFSSEFLRAHLRPFTGRMVSGDELEAARNALTRLYIDAGYVTSGAVLPDQDPSEGTVRFELKEGTLDKVEILGTRFLREWWLRLRLRKAAGSPLNLHQLKTQLQLLRQTPGIAQINAELKPGMRPGESILAARIKEENPFHLELGASNTRPPSVGEGLLDARLFSSQVLGIGDPLDLRWGAAHWDKKGRVQAEGADNLFVGYELPVTPWETFFAVRAARNSAAVLEETFAPLDISSKSTLLHMSLRQHLLHDLNRTLAVSLAAERKHSQTYLLGQPFSLSPGAVEGETDVFATRLSVDWMRRGLTTSTALRSTWSLGSYAFGSSRASRVTPLGAASGAPIPDSKFFSWLLQGQTLLKPFLPGASAETQAQPAVQDWKNSLLVLRANAHLSADPLLSSEQFSLGGLQSVRGYRENQVLRDNGLFASAELQVPLWGRPEKGRALSAGPFLDAGRGWNTQRASGKAETLASVGFGVSATLSKSSQASLYFGCPLKNLQTEKSSLQDYGVHLSLTIRAF